MQINWNVRIALDHEIMDRMAAVADLCLQAEKVTLPCAVSVCLCDDEYIEQINSQYRGIQRSTDVLSFPSIQYPSGYTLGRCEDLLRREYDDDLNASFLGDIIISVPHLVSQANEYGHSVLREALYLLTHGICHLMGYDHIEPEDQSVMRAMEEKILSAASASREEDNLNTELLSLAKSAMRHSYSPYSHYPVGAAIHAVDGRIFTGCNIENASFGLTNCAERTAVFKGISEGAVLFDRLAIAANTKAWPCGACRQVLNEFSSDMLVLITWDGHVEEKKLSELLPEGFGPRSMDTTTNTGENQ